MINRNKFSLFVATFLVIGFFFLALPEKGYSQRNDLGCCETSETTCTGCGSLNCAIRINDCDGGFGFASGQVCMGGGLCIEDASGLGCCVISEGNCIDGPGFEECDLDFESLAWFQGAQCSEVPECEVNVVSAVPTLSEWGLIAMVAVLGIVGFLVIRRRKVSS